MEKTLLEKWREVSAQKNSLVVAGLDPADFAAGRDDKGLPKGADRLEWSLNYIDAVAPHVAVVKYNLGFFQNAGDRERLITLTEHAHKKGLLVMCDSKVSDIGSTNDAWFFSEALSGADVVTMTPFAGNIEETISSAHERGLYIIGMGLMSNPEFATEMHYENIKTGHSLYRDRITRNIDAHVDGLVLGGTCDPESASMQEFLSLTKDHDIVYLVPGIGAQGGGIDTFASSGVNLSRCMISSSRELMFPAGSDSTPAQQKKAAKALCDAVNEHRKS